MDLFWGAYCLKKSLAVPLPKSTASKRDYNLCGLSTRILANTVTMQTLNKHPLVPPSWSPGTQRALRDQAGSLQKLEGFLPGGGVKKVARKEEKGPLMGWDTAVGCLLPLQGLLPGDSPAEEGGPCMPTRHHRGLRTPNGVKPLPPVSPGVGHRGWGQGGGGAQADF